LVVSSERDALLADGHHDVAARLLVGPPNWLLEPFFDRQPWYTKSKIFPSSSEMMLAVVEVLAQRLVPAGASRAALTALIAVSMVGTLALPLV
jgi:hypothetical protein